MVIPWPLLKGRPCRAVSELVGSTIDTCTSASKIQDKNIRSETTSSSHWCETVIVYIVCTGESERGDVTAASSHRRHAAEKCCLPSVTFGYAAIFAIGATSCGQICECHGDRAVDSLPATTDGCP